ncbi:hypothetical protein ACFLXT_01300 [Chloroflexota bacterium]
MSVLLQKANIFTKVMVPSRTVTVPITNLNFAGFIFLTVSAANAGTTSKRANPIMRSGEVKAVP